jgi:16S rRNA (cytidine1402-2'-O)-methyltransferase
MDSGTLYIVSTPIGNLADMTLRAIDVLKSVDLIAAEDTRHTGILLKHYGIQTRQISYNDNNKYKVTPSLLARLDTGGNIAVVSDAGTPGVSDPAFYLARECLKNNIGVFPVPGASALLAALVISGLPTDRFTFEGFLPRSKGKLKARLTEIKDEKRTMIFFESPFRIAKTMSYMLEILGDRPAFVGRELTKKFEQHYYGTITEILRSFKDKTPKGEVVIGVSGKKEDFV